MKMRRSLFQCVNAFVFLYMRLCMGFCMRVCVLDWVGAFLCQCVCVLVSA